MSSQGFKRRDLLRGLGAGAMFLAPFARSIEAEAAGSTKGNFVFFYTPNGFTRSEFGTDGNDAGQTLRKAFQKAAPMKDYLSVVRGLSQKAQHTQAPFHDQMTRLLTCMSGPTVATAYGPSIDWVVAKAIDQPAMNLMIYWSGLLNNGTYVYLSWRGPGLSARALFQSKDAYMQVFGSAMPSGNSAELMAAVDRKKSLIDFLKEDVSLFKSKLSKRDKSRLDVQLDVLRNAEMKLGSTSPGGGGGASCDTSKAARAQTFVPKPSGGGPGAYSIPDFEAHAAMQEDLLVAALACGLRNAGTLMHQAAASGLNPNGGTGKADDHHFVSHGDGAGRSVWNEIDNYYSGRYAGFLKKLQDAQVLDKTVVVWGSEITENHNHNNCTFVVGGGAQLGIKHKKTVSFPFVGDENGGRNAARNSSNRAIADLWLTVQQAVGVGGDKFGEDSTGPIKEIYSG